MRNVLALFVFLAGILQWCCRLDELAVEKSSEQAQLVRTVDGWESLQRGSQPPVMGVGLHPLIVAALQVLVSVLGLVAFSAEVPEGGGWPTAGRRR